MPLFNFLKKNKKVIRKSIKGTNNTYRVYYMQDEEGKKFVNNFKIYEINMDYYKQMWNNKDIKGIEENKYIVMLDLELDGY